MSRRRLIQLTGGAMATGAMTGAGWHGAPAEPSSPHVVLIRQSTGLIAADPGSGQVMRMGVTVSIVAALTGAFVAGGSRSVAARDREASLPDVDQSLGGTTDYWMHTADDGAGIVRLATADGASWWYCHTNKRPRELALPPDLEPGLVSGSVGRWFHGASITAESLGSGELRLMAVDLTDGSLVLDQEFDRRLELAATAISDDGAVIAHVQGGNTGVAVWAAGLRRSEQHRWTVDVGSLPLAPDLIDLRIASEDDGALLVTGLAWADYAHYHPVVLLGGLNAGELSTLPGTLVGIMPKTALPA